MNDLMKNPEPSAIVCIRTIHEPSVPSTKMVGDCGHELWVSNNALLTGTELAEHTELLYMCMGCAILDPRSPWEPTEDLLASLPKLLSKQEIEEIREALP